MSSKQKRKAEKSINLVLLCFSAKTPTVCLRLKNCKGAQRTVPRGNDYITQNQEPVLKDRWGALKGMRTVLRVYSKV